ASRAHSPLAARTQETIAFDLEGEFSAMKNPNGSWSYNQGENPLPRATRENGEVSWVHSLTESFAMTPEIRREDRIQVNPSANSCDANISWTSPCAGWIDIEGSTRHLAQGFPSNQWRLTLDDRLLSDGADRFDHDGSEPPAHDLAAGSHGPRAL